MAVGRRAGLGGWGCFPGFYCDGSYGRFREKQSGYLQLLIVGQSLLTSGHSKIMNGVTAQWAPPSGRPSPLLCSGACR